MRKIPEVHAIAFCHPQSKVPVPLPLSEGCMICAKTDDRRKYIFKVEVYKDFVADHT